MAIRSKFWKENFKSSRSGGVVNRESWIVKNRRSIFNRNRSFRNLFILFSFFSKCIRERDGIFFKKKKGKKIDRIINKTSDLLRATDIPGTPIYMNHTMYAVIRIGVHVSAKRISKSTCISKDARLVDYAYNGLSILLCDRDFLGSSSITDEVKSGRPGGTIIRRSEAGIVAV